jgi:hypothetical protein
VQSGATVGVARRQDEAARGYTALEVIREEVKLIDRAFHRAVPQDGARGGRDLRLHVGGDVGCVEGAVLLGGAACRWRDRGGGAVWSFTHLWREIPRSAWGDAINVIASIETPENIEQARVAGYPAALVVSNLPSTRAFTLRGTTARIIPCPAETSGKATKRISCASCRLCVDRDLLAMNAAIAFEAHGPGARLVREVLERLGHPSSTSRRGA